MIDALLDRTALVALPKAHLHLHLEGSSRSATIRSLAERGQIALPDLTAFRSFEEFDSLYLCMLQVIRAPDDLAQICSELVADEAAIGVAYLEPSINPFYWAERFGLSRDSALAVMRDAFVEAGERYGIEIGLMIGCPRVAGIEEVEAMATFAAGHAGAGVVSFGICGNEPEDAHRPYRRACAIAKEAGLLIVPHAGEQQGPDSVQAALEYLKPDRIAHGFRAVEDPETLTELVARNVVCDVCLSSNVGLGLVADLASHPLPRMRAAGVRITLGADDSLFFASDLLDEYDKAQRHLGATASDLAQIARESARASGARIGTAQGIIARIDDWANRIQATSNNAGLL